MQTTDVNAGHSEGVNPGQKPSNPERPEPSPPRRVFFLVDSFLLGGTETQAVELARRLHPARYQVTLGCLRKEGPLLDRLSDTQIQVEHVDLGGGIDSPAGILGVLKLARLLRRGRFEILHAHDLWSNLVGMSAGLLARVPVRITSQRDLSHGEWYGTYRRRLLRFAQARSSVVLTNAAPIRDGLISTEGLAPEKVCVIHNGVDLEKFRRTSSNRKSLFPNSAGKILVVLVGNMNSDVKGHPVLISAAREIAKKFPHTQFVLVGDGPKKQAYEAQVAESGLTGIFLFMSRRTDVPEILACCDIAVLPSLAEGLPNAVLEYMAAGLPIIASATGGNLGIIQDGETGLLVPTGDAKALEQALTRLLGDDQFRRALAASSHQYVAANFSFERLVSEVDKLYTALLQKAGRLRG
jgi:L-malate glycosyltransferase